jgi:hypothetical protein
LENLTRAPSAGFQGSCWAFTASPRDVDDRGWILGGGTNKIRALKQEKIIRNTKFKFKKYIFLNHNSTIILSMKWEVCEKSKFLSLYLAKEVVGVVVVIIIIIIIIITIM